MLNANARKNFTACGDVKAEELLEKVLSEMKERFSGTDLCVVLGGSYGRGDGGVRQDQENGILYNDLDFFVFARKKCDNAGILLKEIAGKYEKELKVDVDFSRIMSIKDIKNNARRLMMQELKRGYRLVAGEDLLAEYLPEFPAEEIPFSEACRLLLNRGMGLLLAGEKMSRNSGDTDFILRNINKAILGMGDALLIAQKNYKWKMGERLTAIRSMNLPEELKQLYSMAVEFKKSPHREPDQDMDLLWSDVREMFRKCMREICGEYYTKLYLCCKESGETSLKNLIKYCIRLRRIPAADWRKFTMPAVAALLPELDGALKKMPEEQICDSKLYQQWLIFN